MNKIKIYLDTSVFSYLDQKDSPERMKETQEVWDIFQTGRYEIYISDVMVYEISERFDLDDIRKIRDYNAVKYEKMTPAEIVADTKAGATELLEIMRKRKLMKV